ncbi:aminopeptidase [Mycolicibacter terrae]
MRISRRAAAPPGDNIVPGGNGGRQMVWRFIRPVGLAVLCVGVIVLLAPVSISDGDGGSIGCGSIAATDISGALDANAKSVATVLVATQGVPHTNYVAGCQSALSSRRALVVTLVALGLVAAAVGFTT